MINELLEKLLEKDFEDLFEPVSKEEAESRILAVINPLLKDKSFISWMGDIWDESIEGIAEEFNVLIDSHQTLEMLAGLFVEAVNDIVNKEYEDNFISDESIKFNALGDYSIRQRLCTEVIRDIFKVDVEEFKT